MCLTFSNLLFAENPGRFVAGTNNLSGNVAELLLKLPPLRLEGKSQGLRGGNTRN